MHRRSASSTVALLALAALFTGCVRDVRTPGPSPAGAPSQLGSPDVAVPIDDSSPCAVRYRKLKALVAALPGDFRSPGRPMEEVVRMVAEGRESAEGFLAECPDSPLHRDVEYILASFLYMAFDNMVLAKEASGFELADRALALVASAASAAPAGSMRAAECLSLSGYLLKKR